MLVKIGVDILGDQRFGNVDGVRHHKSSPARGGGPAKLVEGSQLSNALPLERWDPSVASRHLPVPGRIR
jgi:hypothetical protein